MAIGKVGITPVTSNPGTPQGRSLPGTEGVGLDFRGILDSKIQIPAATTEVPSLKFSNHALERIHSRGISFKEGDVLRMGQAVDRAEKKGSRETLILMGDAAFIVNIKNKTVVTAMDKTLMKENVFTNIDSTVIL